MDTERYVTKPPRHFKVYIFTVGLMAGAIAEGFFEKTDHFLGFLLIFGVLFLACEILSRLIRFFFEEELILTPEGIESKSRVRSRLTPWRNIIQAVAVKDEEVSMVVLLKSGGHKLSEDGNWEWFCMRNPGKLIRLPDEKQVHGFVRKYYGGLDYDRNPPQKGEGPQDLGSPGGREGRGGSVTIRHLDDLAVGIAMFSLCTGAGIWLSREEGYAPLIVFGVIGLIFLLFFIYIGTKTETISEEGICAKSILKTQWIPWQQVDKVGIVRLNLGGSPGYYLSVTVAGEKKGILLPFRKERKTAIENYYGPLDFDQMANDKIDR